MEKLLLVQCLMVATALATSRALQTALNRWLVQREEKRVVQSHAAGMRPSKLLSQTLDGCRVDELHTAARWWGKVAIIFATIAAVALVSLFFLRGQPDILIGLVASLQAGLFMAAFFCRFLQICYPQVADGLSAGIRRDEERAGRLQALGMGGSHPVPTNAESEADLGLLTRN